MRFCIIGGRGQMGRLFEKIFLSKGHSVSILGRQNYGQLKKEVNDADITIVSVPMDVSGKVIDDVAKVITQDKLVVDFSSVMSVNLKSMNKLKCSSAFIHPLFGPDIGSLKNLNFIVCPLNKGKQLDWFIDFLKEEDSIVTISTSEEHDKIMAVVQGLTHFSNIAFGKTLVDQKLEDKNIANFSTILFGMNSKILGRLFSQEPHVTENIQFLNANVKKVIEQHKKNIDLLFTVVQAKDQVKFESLFNEVAKKLAVKEEKSITVKKPVKSWDKNAIAVFGPRGSFTDAACSVYSKESKKIYVDTIPEIIRAVKDGNVKGGIVPIENSIQGTVTETLDGVNYSGLHITKAIVLPIHQCFAALPNHGEIDTILSHPQALVQCSRFIEKKYPQAKLVHALSTSEAFQQIKEKQMMNAAAIGPEIAAEIYGLEVIKEEIEDEHTNKTKFVLLGLDANSEKLSSKATTSLVIIPFNEKQGILFNMLRFFNEEKINLTKIESRPMKDELGKYIFYIDIDGETNDSRVQKALANIAQHIGMVKVLGCYTTIEG